MDRSELSCSNVHKGCYERQYFGNDQLFQTCDENKVALPTFLIFEPEQVPSIRGESTVIVTRKITEMCNKLDNLMEQNFSKSKRVTDEVPTECISKPFNAVIVKTTK